MRHPASWPVSGPPFACPTPSWRLLPVLTRQLGCVIELSVGDSELPSLHELAGLGGRMARGHKLTELAESTSQRAGHADVSFDGGS